MVNSLFLFFVWDIRRGQTPKVTVSDSILREDAEICESINRKAMQDDLLSKVSVVMRALVTGKFLYSTVVK